MNLAKIWITRWALTDGVLEWEPKEPDDLSVDASGALIIKRVDHLDHDGEADEIPDAWIAKGEWATSAEEATAQVRALASRKADRIEKRVARLRRIADRGEPIRAKPAAKSALWRNWNIE